MPTPLSLNATHRFTLRSFKIFNRKSKYTHNEIPFTIFCFFFVDRVAPCPGYPIHRWIWPVALGWYSSALFSSFLQLLRQVWAFLSSAQRRRKVTKLGNLYPLCVSYFCSAEQNRYQMEHVRRETWRHRETDESMTFIQHLDLQITNGWKLLFSRSLLVLNHLEVSEMTSQLLLEIIYNNQI